MKKKLFILTISIFWVLTINSQTPEAFQYQAVVSNNGMAMIEADVKVRFNIRENTATGTIVYAENHQAKTNAFGMVSLQIGKGTAETNTFASINWSKGTYFIETLIDKGAGYIASGTQQLMSVPFAKYADNAGKIEMSSASGKKFVLTIDEQGNLSAQEAPEVQ